jgi:hypothetical protein
MASWLADFWHDIKGNAKWDLIKYLFGGGVIATGIALVRAASLYWRVQVLIFGLSVVGFAVIAIYQWSRQRAARDTVRRGNRQLVIRSAVYGTGAFDDVDVTDKIRMIPRDALVVAVDNHLAGSDPAFGKVKRLQVEYSYGGPSIFKVARTEGGRLVLPEDSEIQRLTAEVGGTKQQLELAKEYNAQALAPTLQSRVLTLCKELRDFLKYHGPEPTRQRELRETTEHYQGWFNETVRPWRAKFYGDYCLKFADPVPRIRDEIRAKSGLDDWGLNAHILQAASNPNADVKAVEGIIDKLWSLALNLN